VLSGIAGEWETSEGHFAAGLERDRRMGALLCQAEGLVQWAAMRVARGAPEAARPLLDEGLALADSLGAVPVAARARALLETGR
jgi:hypothetical protein